jgi:hypothetical protein
MPGGPASLRWSLRGRPMTGAIRPRIRTNAGPIRAGARVAFPPTGCPTRRPSPARWCSYAYCRSLHITSFRSQKPYSMRRVAQERRAATIRRRLLERRGRRAGEDLERPVERRDRCRPGPGPGPSRRRRGQARPVDPALRRREPAGDVSLNAPPSPVSSCHCWTVPFPYDVLADQTCARRVLQGARHDLAGRRAAVIDQDTRPDRRVDRRRRRDASVGVRARRRPAPRTGRPSR